jgi:photosystem II stability/assembly factor-like uncharacterized protein
MKKILFLITSIFVVFLAYTQTFTLLDSGNQGTTLNGMCFFDENNGIVLGNSGVIATTSNGLTWENRVSGLNADLMDAAYVNANTIIVVSNWGRILKSTDSGIGWAEVYSGVTNGLNSVYVNGTDIYASGHDGLILKSTDEGDSWMNISPGTGGHIFKLFFTSPTIGYAVGNDAHIHKTINGGLSWITIYGYESGISEDFQLRSVYFTDADTGYIVGRNLLTNQGILVRTTDGGATWVPQIMNYNYVDIVFLDNNTGYILSQLTNANASTIFKTTDAGNTWGFLTDLPKAQNEIVFPSVNVGYTCGKTGSIFKVTNINLGIEDLESDTEISVFPNPCSEKITISFKSFITSENFTIDIYSLSGKKLISASNAESVDISTIQSGVYILKVQSKMSTWTKKIIKE